MSENNTEIERKFLVKKLPDLSGLEHVKYERRYIYRANGVEIRVQKKGQKYEFERKVETSKLIRKGQKFKITEEEFNYFKSLSTHEIIRDSYQVSDNPEISLKIYHGKYEGLVRAEIEFESEKEATNFEPLDWFGEEITDSPTGRDGRLIELSEEEFKKLINKQSN